MTAQAKSADTLKQEIDKRNESLIQLIKDTEIDTSYAYEFEKLLDEKVGFLAENCKTVLDFGKSSRHRYEFFKKGQAETADINQFDGYPDRFVDICDATTFPDKTYDGIVCNAVIEHVYEPHKAVKNMYDALNENGLCLCYAPSCYRYHAPEDLVFQDYFRYTKDGLAYLFKDFKKVTLYPVRGRVSSGFCFAFPFWKYTIEKKFPAINKIIDKCLGGYRSPNQTSGYIIWAEK